MDLYSLLPSVIKEKDRIANQAAGEPETILQRVFYAFEQEFDQTKEDIEGLRDLYDLDTCPANLLPYLNHMLGSTFPASWSEGQKRLFLRGIIHVYHRSGQRITWEAILRMLGYAGFFPWELWKEELYEDFDYNLRDTYAALRSARVDLRKEDETYMSPTGDTVTMLDLFRPIHVLYRRYGEKIELGPDSANVAGDSWAGGAGLGLREHMTEATDSCVFNCETYCEGACELGSCEGAFEVVLTCVAQCQTGCEVGCEITCEVGCEVTCETICEVTCEASCECNCEDHCELICETGCELSAETGGDTCEYPAGSGPGSSHFSGWQLNGMTTVNSDGGTLYVKVYATNCTDPANVIRWVDIRRRPNDLNYNLVAFGRLTAGGVINLQEYRLRGLTGQVTWDGTFEEAEFVLTCP